MEFGNIGAIHQQQNSPFTPEEHFNMVLSSLFRFDQQPALQQGLGEKIDIQGLVRVDVKCMINQEFLILKEKIGAEQELNVPFTDIKIEYSFYIENSYVQRLNYLKENFNKEENIIQIILLCSQGIKFPTASDFRMFLELFNKLEKYYLDFKNYLDVILSIIDFYKSRPKTILYRLLICACIFEEKRLVEILIKILSKNLNLESLLKILMICIQYEQASYGTYFYQLLVEYFQYEAGILPELSNPQLQEILYNIGTIYIKLVDQDIFTLHTPKYQYKIDSIFFKPMQKQFEGRKKRYFQPLQKYQFFKNLRKKNDISMDSNYPHIFYLKDEAENQTQMVAYQEFQHAEILVFESDQVVYKKYSNEYLGSIERNYWGTGFTVFDSGYPEQIASLFPRYVGLPRKEILTMIYETNIMASSPRKFQATMLNFVNNQNMVLQQLEPVYNVEKDCYQLNFYGRAKKASARNFELIDQYDQNIIYLLHGKWEKNLFNLDYRYPMTMMQAFSFSLVSISKKFLVQ